MSNSHRENVGRPTAAPAAGSPCDSCEIVREADHRIANHLALLSGFVSLRLRELTFDPAPPTREAVGLVLESVRAQINAVGDLHRALTHQPQLAAVPVDERLHDVCAPFATVLSGRVAIVEDLSSGCTVPALQILPLTQIVTEAITNAVKHGRLGPLGRIVVTSRRDDGGCLAVSICDEGSGLPVGFDPAAGSLGYRLIGTLCRTMGASYHLTPGAPGLCFRLVLPLQTGAELTGVNVTPRPAVDVSSLAGVRPQGGSHDCAKRV